MFQPIPDPEAEWKATNSTWLAQQEAKKLAKKPRLKEARADDDEEDPEFIINQPKSSWMKEDFVTFDDDDDDHARHARYAKQARKRSKHAKHDIADEFLPKDFFNDWNDDDEVFSAISS